MTPLAPGCVDFRFRPGPTQVAALSGKPAGGHGIGLALSRRILESHGGDIVHEPTPAGGATFVVRFPAGHEGPVNGA
jgi:signal transduction histidine kinase